MSHLQIYMAGAKYEAILRNLEFNRTSWQIVGVGTFMHIHVLNFQEWCKKKEGPKSVPMLETWTSRDTVAKGWCWWVFVSFQTERYLGRRLSWGNGPIRLAYGCVYRVFSLLVVDVGGPKPQPVLESV